MRKQVSYRAEMVPVSQWPSEDDGPTGREVAIPLPRQGDLFIFDGTCVETEEPGQWSSRPAERPAPEAFTSRGQFPQNSGEIWGEV